MAVTCRAQHKNQTLTLSPHARNILISWVPAKHICRPKWSKIYGMCVHKGMHKLIRSMNSNYKQCKLHRANNQTTSSPNVTLLPDNMAFLSSPCFAAQYLMMCDCNALATSSSLLNFAFQGSEHEGLPALGHVRTDEPRAPGRQATCSPLAASPLTSLQAPDSVACVLAPKCAPGPAILTRPTRGCGSLRRAVQPGAGCRLLHGQRHSWASCAIMCRAVLCTQAAPLGSTQGQPHLVARRPLVDFVLLAVLDTVLLPAALVVLLAPSFPLSLAALTCKPAGLEDA